MNYYLLGKSAQILENDVEDFEEFVETDDTKEGMFDIYASTENDKDINYILSLFGNWCYLTEEQYNTLLAINPHSVYRLGMCK